MSTRKQQADAAIARAYADHRADVPQSVTAREVTLVKWLESVPVKVSVAEGSPDYWRMITRDGFVECEG